MFKILIEFLIMFSIIVLAVSQILLPLIDGKQLFWLFRKKKTENIPDVEEVLDKVEEDYKVKKQKHKETQEQIDQTIKRLRSIRDKEK